MQENATACGTVHTQRLDTTDDDTAKGYNRTEHLRSHTKTDEGDSLYDRCYGWREDSESVNDILQEKLHKRRMIAYTSDKQFLVMLGVLIPILAVFGFYPRWDWLLIIPLVLLFALFSTGVAFITARLTVHVSDLSQLLPFVSRLLFYSSGVLFAVDKILVAHPWALRMYDFYPLYQALKIARHHLMGAAAYPHYYWAMFAASAVLTFVVGAVFFWRAEERYGRD